MEIVINKYSDSYDKGKEFMSEDGEYLIIKNWHYKPYKGLHSTYDWLIMKKTSPTSWNVIDTDENFFKAYSKILPMKFKNIKSAKKYVLSQYKKID